MTNFYNDISRGKVGESIFIEDFLKFLHIEYMNVTGCQQFQIVDSDFIAKIGTYEIKMNYKDDKKIIIEEYTNINKTLGPISKGWFYKSKADIIVFISKDTNVMVLLPFTEQFKKHYELIKDKYELRLNGYSTNGNNKWQSAFRRIDLDAISGFYSMYKRCK